MGVLTMDGIINFALFALKPLSLLLICRIVIKALVRLTGSLLEKSKLDKGIQTFSKSAINIALWVLAIIMIAGEFGIDTASLVAVVGVASLALSLSVQGIFTNVFSGIVLLLTSPFKVGDYITVGGVSGTVKSIDLMRTTLNTPDNKLELIPNGDISASKITNYSTEQTRRVDLKFTASYDNSTESVKKAIMEVVSADKRILQDPAPSVSLSAYNANDIEYTLKVWVNGSEYWDVYFDINEGVREAYAKYNIEFTYPHTIVHMAK